MRILSGLGVLSLVFSAGCDGSGFEYKGFVMSKFFPFDGQEREWEFVSQDVAIPYKHVSVLNPEFTYTDDGVTRIYDITTNRVCVSSDETCEDATLNMVRWSAVASAGVAIHGYDTPGTGPVDFVTTPIGMADANMEVGDIVTTTGVDGHDWAAEFKSTGPCDIQWTDEWNQCVLIELTSTPEGHWMAGQYWAVSGYNVVARQLTADTARWELSYAKWTPEN